MSKTSPAVTSYGTKTIPVEACDANDWNPNEQDPKTFSRLVEEIANIGFIEPIQVAPLEVAGETRYLILGGEHRWKAAKMLGMTEIPAILLTSKRFKEKDLQKALTVRLNMLKGKLNKGKFIKLVQEFADKYGEDEVQSMFAVTDDSAWAKMVSQAKSGLKNAGATPEMLQQFDDSVSEATTLQDLGEIVNRLFAEFGETVDKGFMVFTWGGKQHIYISMDDQLKSAMNKIVRKCKDANVNINDVVASSMSKVAEDL